MVHGLCYAWFFQEKQQNTPREKSLIFTLCPTCIGCANYVICVAQLPLNAHQPLWLVPEIFRNFSWNLLNQFWGRYRLEWFNFNEPNASRRQASRLSRVANEGQMQAGRHTSRRQTSRRQKFRHADDRQAYDKCKQTTVTNKLRTDKRRRTDKKCKQTTNQNCRQTRDKKSRRHMQNNGQLSLAINGSVNNRDRRTMEQLGRYTRSRS